MRILLFAEENDEFIYVPAWIDENHIVGYYITLDNYEDNSVNLIMTSNDLTVKQNNSLMDYLHKRFGTEDFLDIN